MDHEHFDTLARRVFTDLRQSRRAALATLLGATLLRRDPDTVRAKPKAKTQAKACYPGGTSCRPGKGRNTSGCDFSHSTLFQNTDVRGANLSHSSFFRADLRGADLRGANLSGSCLVGADLTGAKLGNAVNLGGAIFCFTTMPDGRIDTSGCDQESACCRTQLGDQDCPDKPVNCYTGVGTICLDEVGSLGTFGTCWQGLNGCCPCGHADLDYWLTQCVQTFPAVCKAKGDCIAQDRGWFPCLGGCED
jgi:hypothetical protein